MMRHNSTNKKLLALFVLAVAVRLSLFMYVCADPRGIQQPDSRAYLDSARGYLKHGVLAHQDSPERPDAYRMPLYPFFLASVLYFAAGDVRGVVLFQIFLDGILVVIVFLLAELTWKGSGFLAGLLAAFNLGLITYSHFILTETLFVVIFAVLLLILVVSTARASRMKSIALGSLLGIVSLIRPVAIYLPILLYPFLFIALLVKQRIPPGRAAMHMVLMTASFALVLFPWMIRNHKAYGNWRLTAQTGEHLVQYLVPFVWQYSRGVPFLEGRERINIELKTEADKAGVDLSNGNPFEVSRFERKLAEKHLASEPLSAVIKAWFYGMTKNLFAPAMVDFSNLLLINRSRFFATPGATLPERAKNFIRSTGGLGLLLVVSMIVIAVFRILQLGGLYLMVKSGRRWEACLFSLIIAYFLLASGPVGYAKYRLPLEPILAVLAAISMAWIYEKTKQKRHRSKSSYAS